MAKVNRYWRCSDKNHSRITVKSANEPAPKCKKCGETMKREGHTKNKLGTLKARRQVHGELVNVTTSRQEDMRLRQSQIDTARKNSTGIPWKEEPLSWYEAITIYKREETAAKELGNLSAKALEKYLQEADIIIGPVPSKKHHKLPRYVKKAAAMEEQRKAYYRKAHAENIAIVDLRDKAVQDITPQDVRYFLLFLRSIGYSTIQVNHVHQRIHAVYRVLTRVYPVESYQRLHNARFRVLDAKRENTLKDVYTEDNPKPETPMLYTAEEVDLLLRHYEPHPEYHFTLFMCIKLLQRITAAKSFRVSDFDFDNMTYKTPVNTKGGKVGKVLPMPESVAIYVKKWMEDRGITKGWLLKSPYKAGARWQGRTSLIQRVQYEIGMELEAQGKHEVAARMKALRSHKMGRHTGASIMQYLKPTLERTAKLMNHSSTQTTQRHYLHMVPEEERALMEAYDEYTSIPGKIILPPAPLKAVKRQRSQSKASVTDLRKWQAETAKKRVEAVVKAGDKVAPAELAVDLGVSEVTIYRMKRKLAAGQPIPAPRKTDTGYNAEFRRVKIQEQN